MSKFVYRDEEFEAKHMPHACTSFLDIAHGDKYVKHLKENGRSANDIDAIKDIEEIGDHSQDYYSLVQELENGDIFTIEVWNNGDGTYYGLALAETI